MNKEKIRDVGKHSLEEVKEWVGKICCLDEFKRDVLVNVIHQKHCRKTKNSRHWMCNCIPMMEIELNQNFHEKGKVIWGGLFPERPVKFSAYSSYFSIKEEDWCHHRETDGWHLTVSNTAFISRDEYDDLNKRPTEEAYKGALMSGYYMGSMAGGLLGAAVVGLIWLLV